MLCFLYYSIKTVCLLKHGRVFSVLACDHTTFGLACLDKCHCKTGNCDPVKGTCFSKCAAGWHGTTCSEAYQTIRNTAYVLLND